VIRVAVKKLPLVLKKYFQHHTSPQKPTHLCGFNGHCQHPLGAPSKLSQPGAGSEMPLYLLTCPPNTSLAHESLFVQLPSDLWLHSTETN